MLRKINTLLMTPDNAIIKVIKNRKFLYVLIMISKNKDMVLDDSNSDINGHQMIWRKKTAKPNFDCVVVNSDDNAYFFVLNWIWGVVVDNFEAYVEKSNNNCC